MKLWLLEAFTQGSTIELSADAPVVEPYTFIYAGWINIRIWKTFYSSCPNKHEKQKRCLVNWFKSQGQISDSSC